MSRKKEIDEWALDYWLLQRFAKLCYRIYYRKIQFVNRELLPVNQPFIIAPNHQNALMDAMALVTRTNLQNVFLARADIFKGKLLIRFLTFLNIMPVFRIRDGIENVKKNDEVFDKTTRVIHNSHNPLIIFPEGNHGDHRRLRPLVKGLFRIAFQAQEKYGTAPGVKIVPVGIDYGHYQNFRSTLLINTGEPIEISEFYSEYASNPVLAINHLKDVYAERLRKLIIDIQTEEFYELYMHLREIFNDKMRETLQLKGTSLYDKFRADKVMIDVLNRELEIDPGHIVVLNNQVNGYLAGIKTAGIRDHVVKGQPYGIFRLLIEGSVMIALSPCFLFGFVHNILPYRIAASRVKNIKDPQFHSSIKYVTGMIVFPLWYLIIAGILGLLALPFWVIVLYIVLLPLSGLFAFDYFIRLKKFMGKLKFRLLKNSDVMNSLVKGRIEIVEMMKEIVNRHINQYEDQR